jgi:transcriptional regulator with XRE-family HTH domain
VEGISRYTQESLGAKAGIGKSYVSQIEAGTKTGSTKVLRALAKALQVDIEDLLDR